MSSEPLIAKTIPQVLNEAVASHPNKPFIVSRHQGLEKTFTDLDLDASRLALSFKSIGIGKGDRVGIWSPNCYEWVVTQFATAKIGAILVNVNPGYREKEFAYCANLVGIHTLIFSQSFKNSNYTQILDNLSPGILQQKDGLGVTSSVLPSLTNLICLNLLSSNDKETAPGNIHRFDQLAFQGTISPSASSYPPPRKTAETTTTTTDPTSPSSSSASSASSSSTSYSFTDEGLTFDDAINIQFTSGTTGNPKGACLSHHNIINNAYYAGKLFLTKLTSPTDDGTDAVICVPNPLYHCFGSVNGVMSGLLFKSTVVLPAPTAEPTATLSAIDDFGCNVVYGTPTMYVDLLTKKKQHSSDKNSTKKILGTSIRRGIISGAPCPLEVIQRITKECFSNVQMLIPYGATEMSPVITMTPPNAPDHLIHSTVGPPIEHVEVKIANPETGDVLPLGATGEVMARGFLTFVGYYNQPDKTSEALDNRRWYHTGDLGIMNEEGYVSIVGRIKDMIIRGGENIYPREIEDFLLTHSSVIDINVVGVPDERMGEEICAFVIVKDKKASSLSSTEQEEMKNELKSFCKGQISHFKIPKYIIFVDDFPRTVTMKVQKHRLKDMAKEMLNL